MNTDSPKFLIFKIAILIVVLIFFGIIPVYDQCVESNKRAAVRVGQVYAFDTANPFDKENNPITILAISNGFVRYRLSWSGLYIDNSMSLHTLATAYRLVGTSPPAPNVITIVVPANTNAALPWNETVERHEFKAAPNR